MTLGVALAFSVHLINASALAEFSAAVRAVDGAPDLQIVGPSGGFDEALYGRIAGSPSVSLASPVVEVQTDAVATTTPADTGASSVAGGGAAAARVPLRVVGIDALVVASLAPALMPQPRATSSRFAMLDPQVVFLNAEARRRSGTSADTVVVRTSTGRVALHIGGSVAAGGPPLAVIDIAGAQALFGFVGRLTRIDVRLVPGTDRDTAIRGWNLPPGVRSAAPGEAEERVSNVSRAYRVNLTVLALVAMFTGAFLVFSILSLSVAQRQQQLALLGVLGLPARGRLSLVLGEATLIGAAGSLLGLGLGTALAAIALRLFGGDLGGGYFAGVAPALHVDLGGVALYGSLGIVAAMVGGWLPARAAQAIAPAHALKGIVVTQRGQGSLLVGLAVIAVGIALAALPPIADIPLAAYASVACLLIGGIACVPGGVGLVLRLVAPPRQALALLAVERARHERDSATIAVAGVVASLALSVALTVMVASFREAVTQWLDVVLPADLYVRVTTGPGGGDVAVLPKGFADAARGVAGIDPDRGATRRRAVVRSDAADRRPHRATTRRSRQAATAGRRPRSGTDRIDGGLCQRGDGRAIRRASRQRVRPALARRAPRRRLRRRGLA